jgi:hypothetical protein
MDSDIYYFDNSEIPSCISGISNEIFEPLRTGLLSRTIVEIRHGENEEKVTVRELLPEAIVQRSGIWYLAAFCYMQQARRTFRFDRIHFARNTDRDDQAHGIAEDIRANGLFTRQERKRTPEQAQKEDDPRWHEPPDRIEARISQLADEWVVEECMLINGEIAESNLPFNYGQMAESLQVLFTHAMLAEHIFYAEVFEGCPCGCCDVYYLESVGFQQRGEKLFIATHARGKEIYRKTAMITVTQWAQFVESAIEQQLALLQTRLVEREEYADYNHGFELAADQEMPEIWAVNTKREIDLDDFYNEVGEIQALKEAHPQYFQHPKVDLCPPGISKKLPMVSMDHGEIFFEK